METVPAADPTFDWKGWFDLLWPIVLAVPGLIAFVWQVIDRREGAKARQPFCKLLPAQGVTSAEGWIGGEFQCRNDAGVPLEFYSIMIEKPAGIVISEMLKGVPTSKMTIEWSVGPDSVATSKGQSWSAPTLILLKSTRGALPAQKVLFEMQYRESTASRRKGKVRFESEPLEFPA